MSIINITQKEQENFAVNCKYLRAKIGRGTRQKDISDRFNLPRWLVAHCENGKASWNARTKMAQAFGYTVDEMHASLLHEDAFKIAQANQGNAIVITRKKRKYNKRQKKVAKAKVGEATKPKLASFPIVKADNKISIQLPRGIETDTYMFEVDGVEILIKGSRKLVNISVGDFNDAKY